MTLGIRDDLRKLLDILKERIRVRFKAKALVRDVTVRITIAERGAA